MKDRLLSLDVLRGITVMSMILVNNPGNWSNVYSPLHHADWAGLTLADMIFPCFMFLMGVSMAFSLPHLQNKSLGEKVWKIGKRAVLLIVIGIAIGWFSQVVWNVRGALHGEPMSIADMLFPWQSLRLPGVLQRFGVAYAFTSVIILLLPRPRPLAWIAAAGLVLYQVILLCGNGFEASHANVIYQIDAAIFGESHMYTEWVGNGHLVFDPEGLASTLPCLSHVLIGYLAGALLRRHESIETRLLQLAVSGIVLLLAGCLLSYGCPVIKKVWTPSFVLITCGASTLALTLISYLTDVRHHTHWASFFRDYGMNPLFLYIVAEVGAVLIYFIRIGHHSLGAWAYQGVHALIADDKFSSLIFAVCYVLLLGLLAIFLHRKRIFIKL